MFSLCRCNYRQYGIIVIRLGLSEFLQAAKDILFPLSCLGCGAGLQEHREISFCATCLQNVRLLLEPLCTHCGKPFDGAAGASHLCGHCLKNGWHFKQARAVVRYQPPITEAVKIFKYGGKMHGLATFVALSKQYLAQQNLSQPDVLVPVPLHIKKLRQRGFNQALILCRRIFPAWRDRIAPHIMEKKLWTQPQTGLSGPERRRNVRNTFRVRRPETVAGKKILLVDDVYTTGATVNECARILLRNKASEVNVFTFARAID